MIELWHVFSAMNRFCIFCERILALLILKLKENVMSLAKYCCFFFLFCLSSFFVVVVVCCLGVFFFDELVVLR